MTDETLTGMALIRSKRGMLARIAKELGLSTAAPAMWEKVPAERLADVEKATGIERHLLRPDICFPPHESGSHA